MDGLLDFQLRDLTTEISNEVLRAMKLHPAQNSYHEAYAVLLEEVDEFWDEVKKKAPNKAFMRKELVQIAAMACRTILDLDLSNVPDTNSHKT